MKILNIIGVIAMAVGAVKVLCLSMPLFSSDISLLSRLPESALQQVYSSLAWFMAGLVLMTLTTLGKTKPRGD